MPEIAPPPAHRHHHRGNPASEPRSAPLGKSIRPGGRRYPSIASLPPLLQPPTWAHWRERIGGVLRQSGRGTAERKPSDGKCEVTKGCGTVKSAKFINSIQYHLIPPPNDSIHSTPTHKSALAGRFPNTQTRHKTQTFFNQTQNLSPFPSSSASSERERHHRRSASSASASGSSVSESPPRPPSQSLRQEVPCECDPPRLA